MNGYGPHKKKFAWWPVKTKSGERIWLRSYYIFDWVRIKSTREYHYYHLDYILTREEFVIAKLTGREFGK